MNSFKLSILICTTIDRRWMLDKILPFLQSQSNEEVEILYDEDNKEVSVGAKRQRMIEAAKGDYVVFIDVDDWVHDKYIEFILKAIEKEPDCIGFMVRCYGLGGGEKGKIAHASNRWPFWADNHGGYDYVRTIYHKNPVRRSIALKIGFKDMRYAEDHDYSKRLKESGLLKKEEFINEEMYIYQYKHEDHNKKYGIK